MKFFLISLFSALPVFGAGSLHVPQLPERTYADSEVSTNVPFVVDYERLDKLNFIFDLTATATNNFEVALGLDADNDGHLTSEESHLSFGYDCGAWFSRKGSVTVCEASSVDGRIHREVVLHRINIAPTWNLMRVVRRGVHMAEETLSVQIENTRFVLIVR
jgi:hypothetical protein